tara:strand:- start:162 stop:524 length:363 start_codon:yes stop_codon:yes gene_type:complete
MGYHAFDWRAWSIKPENKKLIAENMAKAVNKFKREKWLWEAKFEYLTMAYHPQAVANITTNAGTSLGQEIEIDLSRFATPRATGTMGISTLVDTYLASDGTLVYDETGNNDFRPVYKIYS